jgi:hypothetical protein
VAKGKNEHRMLFDLRGGRRGQVVKVVYALLAVLMGLSLFLVIGGFNIAELFNGNGGSGDAAKPYEEQAERIEVKLKKDPQNPDLLLALTRAHVNAGNAQVSVDESTGQQEYTTESLQEFEEANQSWSEYLKSTDEPSVGLALVMSPTLLRLAEFSRSFQQASITVKSASEAQKIVAEQRPSINSLTTYALYTYFTGDFKAANKAREEAKKFANEKGEREAIDKQLDETEENAEKFLKNLKKAEKEAKAASEGGGAAAGVEPGGNPLGGLGSGGLGE